MRLAVVGSLDAPRRLTTDQEREDFEQALVDQYLLAAVGAGCADSAVVPPVHRRLSAYLDYWQRTWPTAIRPHLLIHARSWDTTYPGTAWWIRHQLGICGQQIRFARILDETHASGGHFRRLVDLFGLSFEGANRYVVTVNRP